MRISISGYFMGSVLKLSLLAGLIIALSVPAMAQTFYGSILGTVTDSAGAIVPDANTILTNQGTQERRSDPTDNNGNYTVSQNFQPGEYSAAASVAADADYGSATSPSVPFTVGLGTRSITLNVSVASS